MLLQIKKGVASEKLKEKLLTKQKMNQGSESVDAVKKKSNQNQGNAGPAQAKILLCAFPF
jgi:hypothetical protein